MEHFTLDQNLNQNTVWNILINSACTGKKEDKFISVFAAEGGEKIRIMHCNKPPPEAEIFGARVTGFLDFRSLERGGGGVVSRIKRIRVNTQKLSG